MYEAKGLAFNQAHQHLYVPLMLVVLIVELLYHDLNQNVPLSQAKSLIKHGNFFLILTLGLGSFIKIVGC